MRLWSITLTVGCKDLPLTDVISGPFRDGYKRKWWKSARDVLWTSEWKSEDKPTDMDVQHGVLFAIYEQCRNQGLALDYFPNYFSSGHGAWGQCGYAMEAERFLKIWRTYGFTGTVSVEPVLEFRDLACLQDMLPEDVIRNVVLVYL